MPTDPTVPQPDYFEKAKADARLARDRVIWRGPSPLFGGMEVECIDERPARPCKVHQRRNCGTCHAAEIGGAE